MKKTIAYVVAAVFLSVLTALFVGCTNFNQYQTWKNHENYKVGGSEYSFDDISAINLDWIFGSVEIYAAENESIKVYETCAKELSETCQMRHYVNNGLLDIKFVAPKTNLIKFNLNKTLHVVLPLGKTFDSMKINIVSSELSVKDLKINNININTVSGSGNFTGIESKIFDVNTVSGNINLSLCKIGGLTLNSVSGKVVSSECEFTALNLHSTSGNFDLQSITMLSLADIDTTSGKIKLILPENNGFRLNYKTVSGNLINEFESKVVASDTYIYGDGVISLKIESTSGDLTIMRKK